MVANERKSKREMDKGIANRVLAIGIDGATFDLLDPWIEAGKLPNIATLISSGVHGRLLSVLPINSVAGWASFATGKNPGKHGLYDFKVRREGSYEWELINGNMLAEATLWDILSAYGKRVEVINFPICYPPQEVDGFMVAGMLSPSTEVNYTYPVELAQELGEYRIDADLASFILGKTTLETYLDEISLVTELRRKATLYLLEKKSWDFFMVVFTGSDRILHFLWGYNDPSHPLYQHSEATSYRARLLNYFRYLDRIIGEVSEAVGEETAKIVLSDHGFGPLVAGFRLNKWLHSAGFLSPVETRHHKAYDLLVKFDRFRLRKRLVPLPVRRELAPRLAIDWDRTLAYAASESAAALFLNLKGREPQGVVEMEEYEEVCQRLTEALLEANDPETGESLVERVHRTREIYWGDRVGQMPDLLLDFKDDKYCIEESFLGFPIMDHTPKRSGTHRINGVFLVSGPNILKGVRMERGGLMDVAPTILHLMGLPIPEEMDGRIIEGIWEKVYPVCYVPASPAPSRRKGTDYSPEEQKEVEERLRGLGYIG